MSYSLHKMFAEAQLTNLPEWSKDVHIVHPYEGWDMSPRKEQIKGLKDAIYPANSRYGLYDDMGSGKSLISYAYVSYYASQGNKCLVIMPPKLLSQYRKNFYSTFKNAQKYISVEILYGTKTQTDKLIGKWYSGRCQPDVILVSANFFRTNPMLFTMMLPCEVVVVDEAKWVGNPDNDISKAFQVFLGEEGSKAALIMNGTPARANLISLFGCIEFTNPGTYSGIEQFKRKHVKFSTFTIDRKDSKGNLREQKIKKIVGYKNLEEFYGNLYKQGRRVELPPGNEPLIIPYEFSLDDKHNRMYRKLVNDKMLEFPDDTLIDITNSASARHICMRAVADCSHLKMTEQSEVIKTVLAMLEETDEKVLLMAYYQSTVELLLEATKKYNPVALYGKTSGQGSERNRQTFINDPECKVLVINYESGGVGVDGLQKVCHRGISVEPTGIPGDFQQAVKRLARPGQEKPVTIHCLIPEGTIYQRVIKDRMKAARDIHSVVSRGRPMTKLELQAELLGQDLDEITNDLEEF